MRDFGGAGVEDEEKDEEGEGGEGKEHGKGNGEGQEDGRSGEEVHVFVVVESFVAGCFAGTRWSPHMGRVYIYTYASEVCHTLPLPSSPPGLP